MFTEWNTFAKVDSTAQIILPANANFADTQTEVNYDRTSDSILGTLVYSYGGRQVGTANVVTTGAQIAAYPFGEKSGTVSKNDSQTDLSEKSAETGNDVQNNNTSATKSNAQISKKKLLLIGGGVVGAIIIVLIICFLYNNIRRIHRRKKGRDRRFKTIKNNRKWNKRGGR